MLELEDAASSEWGCVKVCETIYKVSYYYRNLHSNLGNLLSINQLSKEVGQLAMNTKVADWSIGAVERSKNKREIDWSTSG